MRNGFATCLFAFCLAVLLSNCGGTPDSKSSTTTTPTTTTTTTPPAGVTSTTYFGTQSPGDSWQIVLRSDNTFMATNLTHTPNDVLTGTYSSNSNGSLSFVVSAHNGTALSPTVTVSGTQISSTAVVVVGPGSDPRPIVAFAQGFDSGSGFNTGACSTATAAHEWIRIPSNSFDANADIAFGTSATQTQGSPVSYRFNHTEFLLNGTAAGSGSDAGLICNNGVISPGAGSPSTLNVVISASGAFVADVGSGAGGFAGIERPAAPVDITTSAGIEGKHYVGVIYQNASSTSTALVGADPGVAANQLSMGVFGTASSTTHGTEFSLVFTGQIDNGLLKGTLNGLPFAAVASQLGTTSKTMILGISTVNGISPINFLLTEK